MITKAPTYMLEGITSPSDNHVGDDCCNMVNRKGRKRKIPIFEVSMLGSVTISTISSFEQISIRHHGLATKAVISL